MSKSAISSAALDTPATFLTVPMTMEEFLNSTDFHSTLLYVPSGQAVIVGDSLWFKSGNTNFIIKTNCPVTSINPAAEKNLLPN